MIKPVFVCTVLGLIGAGSFAIAQEPAVPKAAPVSSETLPTLDAATILQPQYAHGLHFTVRPAVVPQAGCNHYLIDSDYGTFDADGNLMLMRRIAEINAIAQLREMSGSDEFKHALAQAAKTPVNVAKKLADDPVETLASVPKGIVGFLKRTGQSVKEVTERRERGAGEGNAVENISGYTKTKRELAFKLVVDPYSTNPFFQEELAKVARPAFAGKFTANLGMAAVGGAAGDVISAANMGSGLAEALRDKNPSELRRMNSEMLIKRMGVASRVVEAFLNNPVISPTTQTIIVDALSRLGDIPGQGEFIRQAAASEDEHDALAFQQSVQIMAQLNTTTPVARIIFLRGLTLCQTADGRVIVPIQWDYAAWTPLGERFITVLKAAPMNPPATGYSILLTGEVSPMAAQALSALGVEIRTKVLPGPLK